MKAIETLLAEHDFFKDLEPQYLELIAGCGKNVRFDAGQYIFHEGESANEFYVIRYGQVALEAHDHRRGQVTLQTLHEGDVLGWSWLIPPYRWHYNARPLTLVRAIALDATCLRTKCDEDHHLGYELLKRFATVIVDRLDATRLQVLDVYG
ncbi:MAG: cyclic nucleotide-binding domain-containing protein [Anaerolineae bacterium]|nr:cyclic nucleotide-binding domain-containing protein [Anaerolineae bacterium]